MPLLDVATLVAALREDGRRLADAASSTSLDAPVPMCPGWRVRDLLLHTGGVHRWAASFVLTGRESPASAEEMAGYFEEVEDSLAVDWYREAHAALVSALEGASRELRCWAFLPAPSPLAFWARRQAHECAIHRVDAEQAAGWSASVDPAFGLDGIDELLNGFMARARGRLVADPPVELGVRPVVSGDGWTVRVEADRRVITPGVVGSPDCELRGRAEGLYLYLWNRLPVDAAGVEVLGDRRVVALWRELAQVRWG